MVCVELAKSSVQSFPDAKKASRPINGTRVPEENMLSNKAGPFFSLLVSLFKPDLFGNENNIKWSSAGW